MAYTKLVRKKLIILGILAAAFLLMIFLIPGTRNKIVEQKSACQSIITGVREGDADGTYTLLSEAARDLTSESDWGEQVQRTQQLLTGGVNKPELISSEESEDVTAGQIAITETYRVDSEFGPWDAVCALYKSDNGAISSFIVVEAGLQP